MRDMPRVAVRPHPVISDEAARGIRARAWRFVFDCYAKKKAATGQEEAGVSTAGEDAKKEINNEFRATPTIPR